MARQDDEPQRNLICRLHAAAATKMLFDLPGEIFVRKDELNTLETLTDPALEPLATMPKRLLTLDPPVQCLAPLGDAVSTVANANWLDAIKYPVRVWLQEDQ